MLARVTAGTEFTRDRTPIFHSEVYRVEDEALDRLTSLFGGATCWRSRGGYRTHAGEHVVETGIVFEVVLIRATEVEREYLREFARWLCSELHQESVLLTIQDASPYFISEEQ